jgi:predicted nuclease of predicted toxin-antitoxin system
MKLLLDENLPHQLRHEIIGHDCITVAFMGWSGVENGELLRRAAGEDFDALLTKDANVQYEQNLVNLPLAVVILHAATNDIDDLRPLLPALNTALKVLPPKQITHIKIV